MFSNIIATREHAQTPSSGVLCDDDVGNNENHNVNVEESDLKEGGSDSEEDDISNFTDDICNMIGGVNMFNRNNIRSNGKKKEREYSEF